MLEEEVVDGGKLRRKEAASGRVEVWLEEVEEARFKGRKYEREKI